MDRLEKIKGYLDRLPKDDAKWLIQRVEDLTADRDEYADELRHAQRKVINLRNELAELKGEAPKRRCPCGHPDDHAGWCPRQGGEYTR